MAYDTELAGRIRACLAGTPGIVEKKMFGGVGFLLNGNMACGAQGDGMIVRLSDADYAASAQQPHTRPFDMTGRPMKGWLVVQSPGVLSDRDLQGWVDASLAYARRLPAK